MTGWRGSTIGKASRSLWLEPCNNGRNGFQMTRPWKKSRRRRERNEEVWLRVPKERINHRGTERRSRSQVKHDREERRGGRSKPLMRTKQKKLNRRQRRKRRQEIL